MEDLSVTKMIYKEVMILRHKIDAMESDIHAIREDVAVSKAKVYGGAMVASLVVGIVFQFVLAIIQKG